MSNTAGSWAFVGAKASKNSAIAQLLIDAGLIIIGKGNMTVWIDSIFGGVTLLIRMVIGICWHENDKDDARMVQPWWPNIISIRGQDRRK